MREWRGGSRRRGLLVVMETPRPFGHLLSPFLVVGLVEGRNLMAGDYPRERLE